jgi:hypothetical protein
MSDAASSRPPKKNMKHEEEILARVDTPGEPIDSLTAAANEVIRIEVEREDDGRYFACWTSADGKTHGCANYSTTVVGALAELCATLLKVDEDKSHESRSPDGDGPMQVANASTCEPSRNAAANVAEPCKPFRAGSEPADSHPAARPQEVSDTISDIRWQCFVPPALARPAWLSQCPICKGSGQERTYYHEHGDPGPATSGLQPCHFCAWVRAALPPPTEEPEK